QTQCFGVVGDGGIEGAIACVRQSAAAIKPGIAGLQFDGPCVVGDGFLEVALTCIGVAAVDEDGDLIRVDLQGGGVFGDGDLVQFVFDVADAFAGLGKLGDAIEHSSEMLRPSAGRPSGAVGEQLSPRFG